MNLGYRYLLVDVVYLLLVLLLFAQAAIGRHVSLNRRMRTGENVVVGADEAEESSVSIPPSLEKDYRFFDLLDANQDGIVNREEYVDLTVERAKQYFQEDRIDAFEEIVSVAWNDFWSFPENGFKKEFNRMEFLNLVIRTNTLPQIKGDLAKWAKKTFHVADADNNVELSYEEFSAFHKTYNVKNGTRKAFRFTDQNNNGMIELKEFQKAGVAYFVDTNSLSFFFGV